MGVSPVGFVPCGLLAGNLSCGWLSLAAGEKTIGDKGHARLRLAAAKLSRQITTRGVIKDDSGNLERLPASGKW